MGLLRSRALPGLCKHSKAAGVWAKLMNLGLLRLDPHLLWGSSGAGKALLEGGKGWGNGGIKPSLPGMSGGAAGQGVWGQPY